MTVSGPMFEPSQTEEFKASACFRCGNRKEGAHYNLFSIERGLDSLKCIFPNGEANTMNFCLFSTSGVNGTYTTLEEIEESLKQYPNGSPEDESPEDYHVPEVTVLIVHPRICCLRYGCVRVTLDDLPYLKKLRQTSWEAVQSIGKGNV